MKTDSIQAQNPSGVKPEAIDALVAFICVEASSLEAAQPHLDTIRAMTARIAELEGVQCSDDKFVRLGIVAARVVANRESAEGGE